MKTPSARTPKVEPRAKRGTKNAKGVRVQRVGSRRPWPEGKTPDKEGWWGWLEEDGTPREIEVYKSETGWLAIWCEDYGCGNYEPLWTIEPGHVPVAAAGLRWTGYLRPLNEAAATLRYAAPV